ncbi:MAG: hypothetical protein U0998_01950 [Moraxellaceae bacterium]|nr:hypothetical protein [Moraxellaceae bacterium]MDZ4385965.1 hypothetical protein [Moraxellaceae bacterium]
METRREYVPVGSLPPSLAADGFQITTPPLFVATSTQALMCD